MMKAEFEKLAGYEVTWDDYSKAIEPMYMATNLSKEDFVKCIDKKRFALPTKGAMLKQMRKEAKHLEDICGRYTDYESEARLDQIAKEYAKRFFGIDWSNDMNTYVFFIKEYEFAGMRGCSFPATLVIGRQGGRGFEERIALI